ncbi:hypothetical protein [Nostocoides veronense]|uniref:hypothetical protein n=1 Tax=Nostocoides veronense TaxID=330836 RepID=UPI0031D36F8C
MLVEEDVEVEVLVDVEAGGGVETVLVDRGVVEVEVLVVLDDEGRGVTEVDDEEGGLKVLVDDVGGVKLVVVSTGVVVEVSGGVKVDVEDVELGSVVVVDVELGSVVVVDVGSVVVVVVLVSGGVNDVVLLLVEDSVPVAKAIPAAIGLPTPAVAAGASAKPPASAMTATGRDMARRERDDPRWRSDMAAFPLRRHNTRGNRQISRRHPTSQPDHTSPSRLPSTTPGVAVAA